MIENDPEVDVFGDGDGFELALNTAQTGRTFQDRSHIFQVLCSLVNFRGKRVGVTLGKTGDNDNNL